MMFSVTSLSFALPFIATGLSAFETVKNIVEKKPRILMAALTGFLSFVSVYAFAMFVSTW